MQASFLNALQSKDADVLAGAVSLLSGIAEQLHPVAKALASLQRCCGTQPSEAGQEWQTVRNAIVQYVTQHLPDVGNVQKAAHQLWSDALQGESSLDAGAPGTCADHLNTLLQVSTFIRASPVLCWCTC